MIRDRNAIILDSEIKKAILGKNEERIKDIEYCDGWRDFDNMGISVICVHDYKENRHRIFMEDNMDELDKLIKSRDCVINYNGINFDNKLMEANGLTVPEEKTYDLLRHIWSSVGLDPTIYDKETHNGFGLDDMCAANSNMRKTGNGAMAPVWWQRGEFGKVLDYCMNDVDMLKQLIDRVLLTGTLINPKTNEPIVITKPNM